MNVGADTGDPRRGAGKQQRRVIIDDDDSEDEKVGDELAAAMSDPDDGVPLSKRYKTQELGGTGPGARAQDAGAQDVGDAIARFEEIADNCRDSLTCMLCSKLCMDLVPCCEPADGAFGSPRVLDSCMICKTCFAAGGHIKGTGAQPERFLKAGNTHFKFRCQVCPKMNARVIEEAKATGKPVRRDAIRGDRGALVHASTVPFSKTVRQMLFLAKKAATEAAAGERARFRKEARADLELSREKSKATKLTLQLADARKRLGAEEAAGLRPLAELEADIEGEVSLRTQAIVRFSLSEQEAKHSKQIKNLLDAGVRKERELSTTLVMERAKARASAFELEKKEKELAEAKAAASRSEDKAEAAARESTCAVCLTNKRNTVFLPCFHLSTCSSCAARCNDACPICRATTTGSMRVFIA
jgi:hypothetical protein